MKEVKTGKNLYFTIYNLLQQGNRPAQICKKLKIKKQKLHYYTSFFKKQGIIQNKGYGDWEILKDLNDSDLEKEVKKRSTKKSSLGLGLTKPLTNLHALQINFPILKGKIKDKDWEIKNKLKNWLPKYKGLKDLGGLTIRNNNNKSLTIFAKARNIKDIEEVDNLAFKIKAFAHEYFRNKHGVILDVFECETKNLNLATEDKASEDMIKKGERFELDLNKKAEKIFPMDKMPGKAWIDGSPFDFSAETNDKRWKKEYLGMPFRILNIDRSMFLLERYNKNLELHTKVQKEQLKTQKAIQRALKGLPAIPRLFKKPKEGQKTLYDFL